LRFLAVTPTGLDFELFVFVARWEERGWWSSNDLYKTILAKLSSRRYIIRGRPFPKLQVIGPRGLPDCRPQHQPEHLRRAEAARCRPASS